MPISDQILNSVFRNYDIRGLVDSELTNDFYFQLGQAFSSYSKPKTVVVGYDMRNKSKEFASNLMKGLVDSGVNVVDIGMISTEMLYFTLGEFETEFDGGFVVTASHNPIEWNGCKICEKGGRGLSLEHGLSEIKQNMQHQNYNVTQQKGTYITKDIINEYKQKVLSFSTKNFENPLKVIVDTGNGIVGPIFDKVFSEFNLDITRLYFEPDGTFPNHIPNPQKIENTTEICEQMKTGNFDIGIAFDGDGDRVVFIDSNGRLSNGAFIGGLFAKQLLKNDPTGEILYDTRVIWPLIDQVNSVNGNAYQVKSGRSYFKDRMFLNNSLFGAEFTSHFFYRDFYHSDSGLVSVVMMFNVLLNGLNFDLFSEEMHKKYHISGEVNYEIAIDTLVQRIKNFYTLEFPDAKISELDGISVQHGKDWRFNLRGSNTQNLVRLNVEAKSKELLKNGFELVESIIGVKRENQPEFLNE